MSKTTDRIPPRFHVGRLFAHLLVATCLVTSPTQAQEIPPGQVAGVVKAAKTREPLAGVFVEIEGLNLQTRTDARGTYSFPTVRPGRYAVVARMLGRAPGRHTVEVSPGSSLMVDFGLDVDPLRLPAIEVLRDRTELARGLDDIPGSVHLIGAQAIDRGNPFHDVHQSLRKVPGVNVREEDGFGLRPNIGIRGTGSERSAKVTLMEDGVLIAPAPYSAPAAYYFPVVGVMHALEVRKGSSQIKYGPRTTGGAVNLVSAPIPEDMQFVADVAGGQNTTGRVHVRAGNSYERVGWGAQAYGIRSNGFKELAGGDTGFEVQNYRVKLRVNNDRTSSTYQELQLKLGYHLEESDETYLGLTDFDFDLMPNRRYPGSQMDVMNADHSQITLRHFVRPSNSIDVTTTAYRNDFHRNWFKLQSVLGQSIGSVMDRMTDFPAELGVLRGADSGADALRVRANNRTYYSQGVQTLLGLRAGRAVQHDIELGGRFHQDREDRLQHEDGFQMRTGSMILTTPGAPGSQSNRLATASAVAFFVQDHVTLGDWAITPGLRYERVEFTRLDYAADDPGRTATPRRRDNGATVLIPGVGVSYAIGDNTRVFGGAHRGFGPPGPGADDEAKSETSVNYELGARYVANGVNAQMVGFVSDYSNILGVATLATGADGTGDAFNGGDVDVVGVEMSVDYDPIAPPGTAITFPGRLAITYTDAEFGASFDSDFEPWGRVERGDELPYVPPLQFHGSIGARHWRWSLQIGANYSARMRAVAGQGPIPEEYRTDAFMVVNASADYRLTLRTSLYAGVQNLANAAYIVARRPAGARPGLPRTLLAGFRIAQ